MRNEQDREEQVMKKFAIVGIVLSGVLMSAAIAQATPGSTWLPAPAQQAQAVPSHSTVLVRPSVAAQQAIIRGKLDELRGLGAVPSKPTAPVTSGSDGFDWNNAGLGAAFVFGALLLGVASLVTIRRHHRPVVH
jgi:hypothetical protein